MNFRYYKAEVYVESKRTFDSFWAKSKDDALALAWRRNPQAKSIQVWQT